MEIKVISVLKSQDLWHFIDEEDPIYQEKFNALTELKNERRKIVAFSLIQDSIDYSLFHYIVDTDTPTRVWNILN